MRSPLAPDLAALLSNGDFSLVVTANQRLARAINDHELVDIAARGEDVFQTVPSMPYSAFLRACYRRHCLSGTHSRLDAERLLSSHQLDWVMTEVVNELLSESEARFFASGALAAEVRRAFELMQQWQISDAQLAASIDDENSELLARCLVKFRDRQREQRFLTEAELPGILSASPGDWLAQQRVLFAGFTDLTPAQRDLVTAIGEGATVWAPSASGAVTETRETIVADDSAAYVFAGQWARAARDADPDARLAIVSPTLSSDSDAAVRLVCEGLFPAYQGIESNVLRDVNLSVASMLSDTPALSIALVWLDFVVTGQRFVGVSRLFRSSLFGERSSYIAMEERLRDLPDRLWTPRALAKFLSAGDVALPSWLATAVELSEHGNARANPSVWSERFSDALQEAGWLASGTLDSVAFQQRDAIFEVFNRLADGDAISQNVTMAESLARLRRIASQSMHQSQATNDSVLIAGPLETIGLHFDACLLVGFDHAQWPPSPTPSSLLPFRLQRQVGMPDANSEKHYDFWSYHTARVSSISRSTEVVTAEQREEIPLRVSAMLSTRSGESGPVDILRGAADMIGERRVAIEPAMLSPLPETRRRVSGYGVLRDQSVSPLSATLLHRWRLRVLEMPVYGVSARLRGILLHRCMEHFYDELRGSDALLALNLEALEQRVYDTVNRAFRPEFLHADKALSALLRLEEGRARLVIRQLVDFERQRPAFSIIALEEKRVIRISGLDIHIRLDRLDAVEGFPLVVDYKTGTLDAQCSIDDLPIRQTQLMAYALAVPSAEGLAGLALFSLGYNAHPALVWMDADYAPLGERVKTKRVEDLPAQILQWTEDSEVLARQFVNGDIRFSDNVYLDDHVALLPVTRINAELNDGRG